MRTGIAIAVLALGAAAGCGEKKSTNPQAATKQAPAARVPVIEVQPQPFELSVPVTGTLVSRALVEVKAETTGRVMRFPKQEGESVQAGEALVFVNDENYRLDVRQAQSAIQVAEAGLERAKVLAEHAAAELERANNLLASGGITDKDLKAARVADQDAKAQVRVSMAQLEQARVGIETARKRERDTVIKAPVSGLIHRRLVNPGAYVEPPTAVFSIVDNHRLELEAPVPASLLAPLKPGQPVRFTVNSYPGFTFTGRLIETGAAVDAETRSARVRIAVDNSTGRLKAGMFAEGAILTGTRPDALVIPSTAVYRDDRSAKDTHVFVVEGGKAVKRAIRIGAERDNLLEVAEGLRAGERLIAEQSIEIGDGVRVEARR